MRQLRDLWQSGQAARNGWLSLPGAFSAELMAAQPWDALTVDMQHGLIDYAALTTMLPAAGDMPILVRVPWLAEGDIMKTLDAGAAGIICPMINTRADAERFAACVRYPPAGRRSFGPIRAQVRWGTDYYRRANDEIVALAMIETREAVANADAILTTPGIDGVYIGPADLSCSYGVTPSFAPEDPEVLQAIDAIFAAAQRHHAVAGIHTNDANTAATRIRQGFSLVTVATDARLISAGAAAALTQLAKLLNAKERQDDENNTTDDGAGAGEISGGATY